MIYQVAPNTELQKEVLDHSAKLHKEAEDALKANEEFAEEIAKYHGDDTKDTDAVVSKGDVNDLKAMYLSESLFEDLDADDENDLKDDIYRALVKFCEPFYRKSVTVSDLRSALDAVDLEAVIKEADEIRGEEPDFFGGLFHETEDMLDGLTAYKESLHEELSTKGKQLVAELKQELGPELQKKVVALMKDLESSLIKQDEKNAKSASEHQSKKETVTESWSVYYVDDIPEEGTIFDNEDDAKRFQIEMGDEWVVSRLDEDVQIKRYSDVVPPEDRRYWYFTTHGVGPGSVPKDLNVLEVKDGQNRKGTHGTFVCLDGVLNTSELREYDMQELTPPEED